MIDQSVVRGLLAPEGSHFCAVPKTKSLIMTWRRSDSQGTAITKWTAMNQNVANQNKLVPILDRGFEKLIASREGDFVAGCCEDQNGSHELHLLRIQKSDGVVSDLQPLKHFAVPGRIGEICFSPDSTSIAVCQTGRCSPDDQAEQFISFHSRPHLEEQSRIPAPTFKAMAYSADGQKLALATQKCLSLWDLQRHRMVWEVAQADLNALKFNSDSQFIVAGGNDRLVTVRNSIDGSIRYVLTGHLEPLRSIACSPDRKMMATGDERGTVKLWNVEAGQELIEFAKLGRTVKELEFSADGLALAALVSQFDDKDKILVFDSSEREN